MVKTILNDLINLFYPKTCLCCDESLVRGEELICFKCLYRLPRTNFHFQPENIVEQMFWGKIMVSNATSFCYYHREGILQKLILKLKYQGFKELGYVLGYEFGLDLKNSIFNEIDLIIPIPLHPKRQKKRGYNQSEWICKGLSKAIERPLDIQSVLRTTSNTTQTKKGRFARWENVENIFSVANPQNITGKHILLVDDVITTGSTIEACAQKILEVENTKVSIATIGVAAN